MNPMLKRRFRIALNTYHRSLWNSTVSNEKDFINRTVVNFPYSPLSSGNQTLQTRARGIHTKPKVRFFRHPLLAPRNRTEVEMGDLLLVYKHYSNGVLDANRASVVQAKYTPGYKRTWKIDTDQFYFMTQWPRFTILGASPRWYSIRPRALTWGCYGFIGPTATRYPLYYSSARMLRSRTTALGTKSFSFPAATGTGWDSSTSFLVKFAQGLIGEDLVSNARVRSLVGEIYRRLGLTPDPPGDPPENPENHNERDKEKFAFGVVEFVVTSEERERKRLQ